MWEAIGIAAAVFIRKVVCCTLCRTRTCLFRSSSCRHAQCERTRTRDLGSLTKIEAEAEADLDSPAELQVARRAKANKAS